MARVSAVHLFALCIVFCVVYLTHVCVACPAHQPASGNTDKSARTPEDQAGGDGNTSPVSQPSLRGAQEQAENLSVAIKSKDIQNQVAEIVQRAVKQLMAQDVLPLINQLEAEAKKALLQAAHRVCSEEEEDGSDSTGLLMALVRLVSAIKAVRADITQADSAWAQLKDSIRALAEAEGVQLEAPEKSAEALVEFLQAEMWMTMRTEMLQHSSRVLRDLILEKEVTKAISAMKSTVNVSKLVESLDFS